MTRSFIDLRSDTVTLPTDGMRNAIAEAEVGDDVYGEDPTILRLESLAARLLGKEAGLFVPSGTMANQIAIRLHTRSGDELICDAGGHPYNYEAGGAAMLSGVSIRALSSDRGMLAPSLVDATFRGSDPHYAPQTLLVVEDTSNRGGGTVHPLSLLDELAHVAHKRGAAAHLDGARLWNAVVASGEPAARRVQEYDTVSMCLSKGLGAPVGSVLLGPTALMERARRFRKALGGGMRQGGFLAAAGIYALENHIARLDDDHHRANILGEGLTALGYTIRPVETNMVYVTVPHGKTAVEGLNQQGVKASKVSETELRLVTHLNIDDGDIQATLRAFAAIA
ncbi:MAG: threonine aldolase [Deltaproteobacteria bacterium]|nr:threonine aldolase [Deltaproteobacteria bacterium]HCH64081.1 threonine aldolase [Deltaproteobacteria bacterium]